MDLQSERNARLKFTLRCRIICHQRLNPYSSQSRIVVQPDTKSLMHLFLRYLPDEYGFSVRFPEPHDPSLKGRYCATSKYTPPDDVLKLVAYDHEVDAFKAAIATADCSGELWFLCSTCDQQPKSFETFMLWKWAQFYALAKAPFCEGHFSCSCPGKFK